MYTETKVPRSFGWSRDAHDKDFVMLSVADFQGNEKSPMCMYGVGSLFDIMSDGWDGHLGIWARRHQGGTAHYGSINNLVWFKDDGAEETV